MSFAQIESKIFQLTVDGLLNETVPLKSVNELSKMDSNSYILLDARNISEYNVSHIKNSKWVGYDEFSLEKVSEIDKNKTLIVYCSVGYRSEKVGEKLIAAGYTNVYNLYGGIFEWVNQNHKVVDNEGVTQKIHGYNATWGNFINVGTVVTSP